MTVASEWVVFVRIVRTVTVWVVLDGDGCGERAEDCEERVTVIV